MDTCTNIVTAAAISFQNINIYSLLPYISHRTGSLRDFTVLVQQILQSVHFVAVFAKPNGNDTDIGELTSPK